MSETTCISEGCEASVKARGMCQKHYVAWKRANDKAGVKVPDGRRKPPAACLVDGCDERVAGRGMCRRHYLRARRLGSTELPDRPMRDKGPCAIEDCDAPAKTRGWCNPHYQAWYRNGDPLQRRASPRATTETTCSVVDCEQEVCARGWCVKHYKRWKRHGSPTARVRGEVVDGCRACAVCGNDVPVSDLRGSYCSACENLVQIEYLSRNPRESTTERWAQSCAICGSEYLADNRSRYACSPKCTRIRNNRENVVNVHIRRAREREATVERFRVGEIYERDNWICGLCAEPIEQNERAPHPRSRSIDHIVPLSLGGEHSRANVQAAHLGCNVHKGARLIQKVC